MSGERREGGGWTIERKPDGRLAQQQLAGWREVGRRTTRSASRMEVISGVVTMTASLAGAMALRKPMSMPAGQSMNTYWNPFSTRSSASVSMFRAVMLYRCLFFDTASRARFRQRLSLMRA